MITYFVAFVLSLVVGTATTLVVRNRAHAWNLLDRVGSSRKVHTQAVPRLGGIAIVAGFFAPLLGLLVADQSGVGYVFRSDPGVVRGIFAGGLAIALLGLYDDLRGAGARLKFAVQFAVAVGLYLAGFRVELLANPFGEPFALGPLALPFTLLWIVGVINALNLIDGLDGLAGGVAFFVVGTNFVLAVAGEPELVLLALFMASLGGAVLGFLVFNFNPASIFMGDTGAMFLGFVLAAVSIKTSSKAGTAVAMLVPVIALGLPIMDTLLAMARRTALGRPLFSADRDHIHHRLMSRVALSHRNAVLVMYAICCLFALTALGLAYANSVQTAMLLSGVAIVVFVMVRKLGYFSRAEGAQAQAARRRNTELRQVVRDVGDGLQRARVPAEAWEALKVLGPELGLARLRLELATGQEKVTFEVVHDAGISLPIRAQVEVRSGSISFGALEATWMDGRGEVNRDEELALELLTDVLARRLVALQQGLASDRVVPLRK